MAAYVELEVLADQLEQEELIMIDLNDEEDWYQWRRQNAVWPIDPVDLCGFCNDEIEDERKRGYVTLCRACNHQYHMDEYSAGCL